MSFLDFFKNLFGKKDEGQDQPQAGMSQQPAPQQTPQTGPAQTSTPPQTGQS